MAYVNNTPLGRFHVYTRAVDGRGFAEPLRITDPNDFGRSRFYFSSNDDHIQPTFSPDGQSIASISNRTGLSELRMRDTYGGEDRLIAIEQRIHRQPMHRLEVSLREGAIGELTPARIYMKASKIWHRTLN